MSKLENMPVSALLSQNRVFSMLIKRSKTLSYTKIPQKTENLSKMVRGALFGTFCNQYYIISSKETYL